jgi:hypothetical protein
VNPIWQRSEKEKLSQNRVYHYFPANEIKNNRDSGRGNMIRKSIKSHTKAFRDYYHNFPLIIMAYNCQKIAIMWFDFYPLYIQHKQYVLITRKTSHEEIIMLNYMFTRNLSESLPLTK